MSILRTVLSSWRFWLCTLVGIGVNYLVCLALGISWESAEAALLGFVFGCLAGLAWFAWEDEA